MAWYNTKGKENDFVVSSRIRFARNIADYPFAGRLDNTSANEIINKVRTVLGDDYKYINFADIAPAAAASYVEKHYASPEFTASSLPHALLLNEELGIAVMVCEEDHIRLQCVVPGLALEEAFKTACTADDILGNALNIAYDEKLGYLTHCPTNLGTAMRASVMMFLPALTMTGKIGQLSAYLPKVGLIMRGMYGEGSGSDGCLYQISNRVTLGLSEEDIIVKLSEAVGQIITMERQMRETIKDSVDDTVCRSYGIMRYARSMTSKEFMKLFADVRLGVSLGIIDGITNEKLGEIMINVLPATLMTRNGGSLDETARDKARAAYISGEIKDIKN